MNPSIQHLDLNRIVQPSSDQSRSKARFSALRNSNQPFVWVALLAGVLLLLFSAPATRAQGIPPGCTGSAIGISLFTSAPDVHVGDTIFYSVSVFNGLVGNPTSCDASNIVASITTPDGVIHPIVLTRTYLSHAQSDFYTNVVSYVVRAQDIRSDGTVRATAEDTAVIYQNDTPSNGGANQGVNTQVSQPCIGIAVQCVGGVGENGAITFTGTVTNCGNNTLVGVTVTNFVNGGQFHVTFITNLLARQIATFSGSWVPLNPCSPSTATFVAQGVDQFTTFPRTVTISADTTCQNTLTPGIKVTKVCPAPPVSPGQLLTFSGSVSNTGNVTLTNIVVVNDQPAPNTPVFTRPTLAPGEVVSFNGSYIAPTDCSVTDTLTATAASRCGVGVSSIASATCPILTTPGITVTEVCPITPGVSGGSSSFSGVVRNSGNITLNNVMVISDRPAPNTVVFTVASLAPGASANYSGNFTVPLNVCSVATAVRATGNDSCSGAAVTNTATATCPITTTPAIAVTLACPATPVATGGLITYTGTVRNSGNVTLNNVTIVNNQASPSTVLTVPSLAPGASEDFTASFTAPTDACSVSSTVTASGSDNCGGTVVNNSASATCTLATTPRITITQICPPGPSGLGGLLTYSGTVMNAGNITLTNVVVTNDRTGASPVFTVATLAPGASANFTGSYTVPTTSGCAIASTLTANARDKCTATLVTANATATCPVQGAPNIAVTLACPVTPTSLGGLLTFSGTVRNAGNVTVTNVVVRRDAPAPNTVVFSVPSLAPGASANFSGSYSVPGNNACSITTSVSVSANDQCAGSGVVASATIDCPLVTAPRIVVTQTCPANPVAPGGLIVYDGSVSNPGNVTLTNITVVSSQPAPNTVFTLGSLAPGASASFTSSFNAPLDACSATSTLTATGRDQCNGNSVNNSVTTTCPLVTAPQITVTKACPSTPVTEGGLLVFTGTVTNTGNITLTNIFVVNNRPAANTTVLGPITLAPGAGTSFSGSYTAPLNACSVTDTLTASGRDKCTGSTVTNSISATCPVGTVPQIAVTLACPVVPVATGGLITYTGTVRNSGNVTLNNVTVVNNQASPSTVLTVPSLAPGASANFTASFTAPADACSVSSTVTASGSDNCAGTVVNNSASATCTLTTTPSIAVTQDCPTTPTSPGGIATFAGTVRNTGNITLTNVNVVRGAPTTVPPATAGLLGYWALNEASGPVALDSSGAARNGNIIDATRVSGKFGGALSFNGTSSSVEIPNEAALNFSGQITMAAWIRPQSTVGIQNILAHGYTLTPARSVFLRINNGFYQAGSQDGSTLAASAPIPSGDIGNFVHITGVYNGSAWIIYRNGVALNTVATGVGAVTVDLAWAIGARAGGTDRYFNGVIDEVRLYNRALTDAEIAVLAEPAPAPVTGEPVFTAATLAPGTSASFTGSYTVPANSGCSITSTLSGSGYDKCTGVRVIASTSSTCPVVTAPAIVVTQTCPTTPVLQGGLLTYNGTVRNSGNITLTNIVVVNNRPAANTVIFTVATLAPGATANFTGSYQVPLNCCVVSSTVGATGKDICTGLSVADTFTATCTVLTVPRIVVTKVCPTKFDQPGTLKWNVPGEMLTYSGTVSNAGNITLVEVTVVNTQPSAGSPAFGPITLAPGESVSYSASYIVPTDFCGTDTVTARGLDACSFAPVVNSVTTTCPIMTTPRILVTKNCPSPPTPRGGVFTFTGTVSNPGDVTLTNVVVVNNYQVDCYLRTNGPVIGPITLAPGAFVNFSGSYTAPLSCCQVVDTLTASGQDRCAGTRVAATATALCPLLSTPRITVTRVCPQTPVPVGGVFTYSGLVSNAGDVVLTNVTVVSSQPNANTSVLGPLELAPGETKVFSGSYTVTANSDPATDTVTARGIDTCQGRTVTATANCVGPVTAPAITSMTLANGMATVTWTATPGSVYTLQCKTMQQDANWISIPGNVTASGNTASKNDAVGSTMQRFYRVMVVQ
jgi:uncharacterized repeat protein (TIGR01451 family)